MYLRRILLSRASEAGSPTNRSGRDKTLGQGSFGPPTGGSDRLNNHLDKKFKRNEPHTWFAFLPKTGWAWHVTLYMGWDRFSTQAWLILAVPIPVLLFSGGYKVHVYFLSTTVLMHNRLFTFCMFILCLTAKTKILALQNLSEQFVISTEMGRIQNLIAPKLSWWMCFWASCVAGIFNYWAIWLSGYFGGKSVC